MSRQHGRSGGMETGMSDTSAASGREFHFGVEQNATKTGGRGGFNRSRLRRAAEFRLRAAASGQMTVLCVVRRRGSVASLSGRGMSSGTLRGRDISDLLSVITRRTYLAAALPCKYTRVLVIEASGATKPRPAPESSAASARL